MRRLISVFLVACAQKTPPAIHHEPAALIEASAPVASASAATEEPTPPPATAGCRHAIPPGTDIAHVTDVALRELILGGAPGKKKATDCLGGTVEYAYPVPPSVQRFDVGATRMVVFVTVAKEPGYMEWRPGFVAIVRVDHDEIVTEGVGPEQLDDNALTAKVHLAMLDGHPVILVPHVVTTGEGGGDFESAWVVSMADEHGAIRSVGSITNIRSIGNGSIMSGQWFHAMDTTLVDAGDLRVEERWEFVREGDAGEERGKKRTVIRAYTLRDGKLVAQ